eukprot:213751_1
MIGSNGQILIDVKKRVEHVRKLESRFTEDRTSRIKSSQNGSAKMLGMLQNKEFDLKCHLENSNEEARKQQSKLESISSEMSSIKDECERLPKRMKSLVDEYENTVVNLKQRREELLQIRQKNDHHISALADGIRFMENRLGMKFDTSDDLRITFWHIDDSNPLDEFWVKLRIDDRVYSVTGCEPRISTDKLNEVLSALNKSNDFSRFLQEIRLQFIKLCQKQ